MKKLLLIVVIALSFASCSRRKESMEEAVVRVTKMDETDNEKPIVKRGEPAVPPEVITNDRSGLADSSHFYSFMEGHALVDRGVVMDSVWLYRKFDNVKLIDNILSVRCTFQKDFSGNVKVAVGGVDGTDNGNVVRSAFAEVSGQKGEVKRIEFPFFARYGIWSKEELRASIAR